MREPGILHILEPECDNPNFVNIVPDPRPPQRKDGMCYTMMMYFRMYLILRLINCLKLLGKINICRRQIMSNFIVLKMYRLYKRGLRFIYFSKRNIYDCKSH